MCSFKCLFYTSKNPGLAHGLGKQSGTQQLLSQGEALQVLLRRHLPALLEAEITRREKSQANTGK